MRCCLALLDIIAALPAKGLPGPALAGPAAGRCILAALTALGLAVSVLVVSALLVSGLLSALGSTTAGRSTYFGASAASALFDASVALGGAGAACVSLPASDKLRSPACAAADAKTNPRKRVPVDGEPEPVRGIRKTGAATGKRRLNEPPLQFMSSACCYWQRYVWPSSSFVKLPGWHLMKLRPSNRRRAGPLSESPPSSCAGSNKKTARSTIALTCRNRSCRLSWWHWSLV